MAVPLLGLGESGVVVDVGQAALGTTKVPFSAIGVCVGFVVSGDAERLAAKNMAVIEAHSIIPILGYVLNF
jgi:hypothetical protein